jgi:hypothetical protein
MAVITLVIYPDLPRGPPDAEPLDHPTIPELALPVDLWALHSRCQFAKVRGQLYVEGLSCSNRLDSYLPRTTFANVDVPVSAKHHVRERGQLSAKHHVRERGQLSAKHHVRERGQLQPQSQSVSGLCIWFILTARPMVQALAQCELARSRELSRKWLLSLIHFFLR